MAEQSQPFETSDGMWSFKIHNLQKRDEAMTMQLPPTAAEYVRSINDHDPAAFNALFAEAAFVNDAGREFRGRAAIESWSDRDIFDAQVTLEVISATDRDGETVITTKVEGSFDRTGLPDPVIINHHITVEHDRIVGLTCRLGGEKPGT